MKSRLANFRFASWSILAAIMVLSGGCGRYPAVSRPCYDAAKVIVNVCNAKNADQLPQARELIESHWEAGEITEAEHGILHGIIELANEGDWDAAETEARKLIVQQADW